MLTIATSALFLTAFFPLRAADENAWQTSGKATVNDDAGKKAIHVSGDGASTNLALWKPTGIVPDENYRLSFLVKPFNPQKVGGRVFAGPRFGPKLFYPMDFWLYGTKPAAQRVSFRTPRVAETDLFFGERNAKGDFTFFEPLLEKLTPFYRKSSGTPLGDGEQIRGRQYSFITTFREGMLTRPLHSHSALFFQFWHSSNGWIFNPGSDVIYRHKLEGVAFEKASIEGRFEEIKTLPVVVSFSKNGTDWLDGVTISANGVFKIEVPAGILPCEQVYVRFQMPGTQQGAGSVFAKWDGILRFYRFDGTLNRGGGAESEHFGETSWVGQSGDIPGLDFSGMDLKLRTCGSPESISFQASNRSPEPLTLKIAPAVSRQVSDNGSWEESMLPDSLERTIPPGAGESVTFKIPPPEGAPGPRRFDIRIEGSKKSLTLRHEWYATDIQLRSPGWRLVEAGTSSGASAFRAAWQWVLEKLQLAPEEGLVLWQAPGFAKVGAEALPPAEKREVISISAARNEAEGFQILVGANKEARRASLKLGPLVHQKNSQAVIPESALRLSEVAYVPVVKGSDPFGSSGLWPDPLPPLGESIEIPAGRNQPLHFRIHVPKDAVPGKYFGTAKLQVGDKSRAIPVELNVFAFALPQKPAFQTALGINWGQVWRYHGIKTTEEKRQLWQEYIDLFDAYRISPFDPVPLDFIDWNLPMPSWIRRGEIVATEAKEGTHSLLVNSDRSMAEGFASMQELIPPPRAKIAISFWYKTESATEPAGFVLTPTTLNDVRQQGFSQGDAPAMSSGHVYQPLDASPEWRLATFEFPAAKFPSGQKLSLRLYPTTRGQIKLGKAWFDDLKIRIDDGEDILKGAGAFELKPDASNCGTIDTTRWEEAIVRVFENTSLSTFRLQVPGIGHIWDVQWFQSPTLGGFKHNTPEHRMLLEHWLSAAMPVLKRHQLDTKCYLYYLDEPHKPIYPDIMESCRYIHSVLPEARIMTTEPAEEGLFGGPNIWVPRLDEVWADRSLYKSRLAAGDEFWTYLCVTPWAPSPSVFLDAPATGLRSWIWQSWVLGSPGILYWETTFWNSAARAYPDSKNIQNPWVDPQFWLDSGFLKSGDKFPFRNGDGTWIYPPRTASGYPAKEPLLLPPVPSLRLESLRDGLDDFDYLRILESRLAELPSDSPLRARATELLERLKAQFPSLVEWSKDPTSFEQTRAELAGMIEELSPASK